MWAGFHRVVRKNILLLREGAGDKRTTKGLSKTKNPFDKDSCWMSSRVESWEGCQSWVPHSGGSNDDLHTHTHTHTHTQVTGSLTFLYERKIFDDGITTVPLVVYSLNRAYVTNYII